MYESAMSTIKKYIDKYLFEPRKCWSDYRFRKRSHAIWAAQELLSRLTKGQPTPLEDVFYQELTSPVDIILEFIEDMDRYYETTEKPDSRFIFSVAKETARDILYLFE